MVITSLPLNRADYTAFVHEKQTEGALERQAARRLNAF
jgi:hypothetical protein